MHEAIQSGGSSLMSVSNCAIPMARHQCAQEELQIVRLVGTKLVQLLLNTLVQAATWMETSLAKEPAAVSTLHTCPIDSASPSFVLVLKTRWRKSS